MAAFDDWDTAQKNLVKGYVDDYPLLTDAQMVTQLYTQRAVGFWHISKTVAASQDQMDCDVFLIARFLEYGTSAADTKIEISLQQSAYIMSLANDPLRVIALSLMSEFWIMYDQVGYVTSVKTTYTYQYVPDVVADDIADIRAMP